MMKKAHSLIVFEEENIYAPIAHNEKTTVELVSSAKF